MPKVTTAECKKQIKQILSDLEWKRISKNKSGSDVPDTTKRVFQSGIFQAHVYTDQADKNFVSVKFLLNQSCKNCTCDSKENKMMGEK